MSTAAILTPLDNRVFGDLAKALTMSFIELGWTAMWLGDKDQVRDMTREIDLAVVLTPFDYRDVRRILPRATKVLYQLETLPWPNRIHLNRRKYWKWDKLQPLMKEYDYILESDKGNIANHYRWYDPKRPVFYCPVGYSQCFELPKKVATRDRALFIGSTADHPRYKHRMRTLRFLQGKLKKRFGISKSRWGDKARQTAKNAAVNVNIHQANIAAFESLRLVGLLLSNQCFTITEPCFDMGPLEHLEHLVVVNHNDMAAEISYYLETPWERERIAQSGYEFVKKHFTMTENLKSAVEKI